MGKKSIEHSINEESRYLLDGFADKQGKPFDATHLINNAVSNIICKICFGYRFDYSDPKFAELIAILGEQLSDSSSLFANFKSAASEARTKRNAEFIIDFVRKIVQV